MHNFYSRWYNIQWCANVIIYMYLIMLSTSFLQEITLGIFYVTMYLISNFVYYRCWHWILIQNYKIVFSFVFTHVFYNLISAEMWDIHVYYSEVPIIRPPMVLVDSDLNSEQVSKMRPIYIENCFLELKQVVLIAKDGLNIEWS